MSCWQLISTKAGAGEAGYVLNMNEIKLRRNKKYELYEIYRSEDTLRWIVKYNKVRFKIYFKNSYGILWGEVVNIEKYIFSTYIGLTFIPTDQWKS